MENVKELTEEERDFMFDLSDFNGLKDDFEYKCCFSEDEALEAALSVREFDCI